MGPEVKLGIVYDVMRNSKDMTSGTSSEPHEYYMRRKVALHDKCKVDKRHAGKTGLHICTIYLPRYMDGGPMS